MFQEYFNSIQKDYLADSESSEHTFRTYLQVLLDSFEKENIKRHLTIKHEPTDQDGKGRPDFKVTTKEQLTIGLIETKKIGENLSKILTSKQLDRYKQLSENIIVTDYLHFVLIKKGETVKEAVLCSEMQLQKKRFKVEQVRIDELSNLLKLFFESEPDTIYKTKDLALKLAEKAKWLKDYSQAELEKENNDESLLTGLYEAFKQSLLPLLDKKYFADIYAQTLTYGLFLSALNCNNPEKELNKDTAYKLMPNTFPLIKELFKQLDDFPNDIVWAIDEIITILKVTDFTAIQKEFAEYRHAEKGFNDPFIFFYEDFLKHYDKSQRELRGVYYTPEPVVSFIVRSVESILKDTFDIKDGFIGKNVTVLDFACGTGTFLLNVYKQALEQAKSIGDNKAINKLLNEQLLNNFYGFELLVAPYVVAHLKISEYLKEQGFEINEGKRLNIFLTNTLSNKEPQPFPTMPSLSKEGKEANKIKNQDILVILGNPPYSGHSANKGEWIQDEMQDYYQVDGHPLGEKNPKWLQDDYVKFIRFAQWKMDKVEKGIVGIITNHSYLDNPTFRGMRQSLMKSFDEIYILDLHGNFKKKEKCPDGSKDENVFDIQQGVAIALFIKKDNKPKTGKIHHCDSFGVRQSKYENLWEVKFESVKWNQANPNSPFYLFKPRDEGLLEKYNQVFAIKEIFKLNSNGIITKRDKLVVNFNKEAIIDNLKEFLKKENSDQDIAQKFSLPLIDKDKWVLSKTREYLILNGIQKDKIIKLIYRPFDKRFIYYDDVLVARTVKNLVFNLQEDNVGLVCGRAGHNVGEEIWDLLHIVNSPIDLNLFYRGGATTFPLYILSNGEEKVFFGVREPEPEYFTGQKTKSGLTKTDNFTKEFREYIKTIYKNQYTPEQILGYIYAVLHSSTYREKYIEFLKIDFPRIPFTDDEKQFQKLSEIGWELIQHHLLKKSYTENICRFEGGDNFKVEKVLYDKGKVWINDNRYFDNVPLPIWEFHIGGYQVLDKWLKERKKHEITLPSDDYQHFIKVVNVLDYTIRTMKKIDELTREWV